MKFTFPLCVLLSQLSVSSGFVTPSVKSHASAPALSMSLQEEADHAHLMSARAARIVGPMSAFMASLAVPMSAFAEEAAKPAAPAAPKPAAPAVKSFATSVQKFFPGATDNTGVAKRVSGVLKNRGYDPTNTLFGASLCSDEINGTPGSLQGYLRTSLLNAADGGVFSLGGLAGLPFVGTSGMGAFMSHSPASGKILILFGPHVGVSNEGIVGKVERVGQTKPSTSCGAAVGAYKAIVADTIPKGFSGRDFQEEYIIQKLDSRLDGLNWEDLPPGDPTIAFVTKQTYKMVLELLEKEVEGVTGGAGFWDKVSEVTLLGGIVVNRGHGQGTPGGDDYFQPLMLRSLTAKGEADLFDTAFGDLGVPKRAIPT